MRFRPTPPARDDRRNTARFDDGELKRSTSACRLSVAVLNRAA